MEQIGLCAGFFFFSLLCCYLALWYAKRRQLFDLPGDRRSHLVATPRGGGAGIVLAMLFFLVWLGYVDAPARQESFLLVISIIVVAGMGWWDDHRPLPASWRLAAHCLIGVLWCIWLLSTGGAFAFSLLMLFFVVGMINAWNFMDGINGLAISQAMICCLGFVVMGSGVVPPVAMALLLSCLAFLPFNFPKARIFLGDVGSGVLGLLLAALLVIDERESNGRQWLLLLLPMIPFIVDTGTTLLERFFRGENVALPHREHLYQWCVRSGWSHAQVTYGYAVVSSLLLVIAVLIEKADQSLVAAAVFVAIVLCFCAGWVLKVWRRRITLSRE